MSAARIANPAWESFSRNLGEGLVFGEVSIRREGTGYELRHHGDESSAALRAVEVDELRELAQRTETGQFRPLKGAPNLKRGWRCYARNEEDLERALNYLYPGAVTDWFASRCENAPITNYRAFTARQTGMYRITTKLNDEEAGQMIRECCHETMCVKARLWTVAGLAPEGGKSVIPCLEPCAVLLEFARTTARTAQSEKNKN